MLKALRHGLEQRIALIGVGFVLLFVTFSAVVWTFLDERLDRRAYEAARAETEDVANTLVNAFQTSITKLLTQTETLAAVASADPDHFAAKYETILDRLVPEDSGILNVALAPDYVITQVYPHDPNAVVIGLDILSQPFGTDSIRTAVRENRVTLSGPSLIKQGHMAFITRAPISKRAADGADALWGVLSVVRDARQFYADARLSSLAQSHEVAIRSLGSPDGADAAFWGDAALFDSDAVLRTAFAPGIAWQIALRPRAGFNTENEKLNDPVFAGYLMINLVLMALLVTALLEVHKRLRTEALLIASVNVIDDGFVIYDAEDRLLIANDAYRKIYPESADLFVPGKSFSEIIWTGVQRGQYKDALGDPEGWFAERMRAHGKADSDCIQHLSDGRWVRVAERKTPGGATVGIRADVTDVMNAKLAAEHANQAKSQFIGMLSHELRTPLTVILGHAKLIEHYQKLPEFRKLETAVAMGDDIYEPLSALQDRIAHQGQKVSSSGRHLLKLINDILDFSSIEAGRMDLDMGEVDTHRLVRAVIEDMSELADNAGITLVGDAPKLRVRGDTLRLKQVLINLVGNAIKFSRGSRIEIGARSEGRDVTLSVRDDGCGIPEAMQEAIFEEFRQLDNSDNRQHTGTGLGLAICRRLAELHGGTIRLHSAEGAGSTFSILLPDALIDDASGHDHPAAA